MRNFPHRKRIAVIGGGISGLAAAHRMNRLMPDADVHLFESGKRVGGVIQTNRKDGFLIEGAADNFITTSPGVIELCNDLGLGDELIRTNVKGTGAMVLSRGKLEPIPAGFMVMAPSRIWPLVATKILSPLGKLRSGCEVFVPRKRNNDDESLQSFVTRRFGNEMFERLVQPLVGGIYTANPMRLSVSATMPRFLEMERSHGSLIRGMIASRRAKKSTESRQGGARYSQFMTLAGGMSRLIHALANSLPDGSIHFQSPVRGLQHDGQRWTLELGDTKRDNTKTDNTVNGNTVNGNTVTFEADAVVIAAPANHAAAMLRVVDAKIARRLARIEYASCAVVSLAFRRNQIRQPIDSFGFVVPHVEQQYILSCSFASEKYDGRAPADTVLMRVFIGGAMQPGLLQLPDNQLIELAHWEIAKLLDVEGEPLMRHITRQNQAMPQYHVGHKERIAEINEQLKLHPTLALAGSSLSGVGVPGCIDSGQKAATRISQALTDGQLAGSSC